MQEGSSLIFSFFVVVFCWGVLFFVQKYHWVDTEITLIISFTENIVYL